MALYIVGLVSEVKKCIAPERVGYLDFGGWRSKGAAIATMGKDFSRALRVISPLDGPAPEALSFAFDGISLSVWVSSSEPKKSLFGRSAVAVFGANSAQENTLAPSSCLHCDPLFPGLASSRGIVSRHLGASRPCAENCKRGA